MEGNHGGIGAGRKARGIQHSRLLKRLSKLAAFAQLQRHGG
jgi:hypothetical protein